MIAVSDGVDERAITKRSQYIERTTDLRTSVAKSLAWREAGFPASSIARKVDSTKSTVRDRLRRTAAQYGPQSIETRTKDERTGYDLESVTRDEIEEYADDTVEWWKTQCERHPDVAPEWWEDVGPDADAPEKPDWIS